MFFFLSMLLFAHQASDALRTTPIVKSTRSQPPLVFRHSGQAKRRNGSIQAVPDNVIIDDLIQGSANAAAVVGKVGWEGVKLFGTGVKVAAPVIGQGVKLTIETATPVVRDGIDTAAPVVSSAIKDGVEAATNAAAPIASTAAQKALDAIQPFLDSGNRVPDALYAKAELLAGKEQVAAAVDAAQKTRGSFASALRDVAGMIDNTELPDASPPSALGATKARTSSSVYNNPLASVIEARERNIENALESTRRDLLAPLVKLQEEVRHKAEEFVALVALGGIGLALVRQFLKPLEELVQRALLAAIAVGLVYGFATYGPKAVAVYEILNDETTRLEKAVR